MTPQLLLHALALDFNEHNTGGLGVDGKGFSQEDNLFKTKLEKGTRLGVGHYEILLPFRNKNVVLPDNKSQLIKRADVKKESILLIMGYTVRKNLERYVQSLTAVADFMEHRSMMSCSQVPTH